MLPYTYQSGNSIELFNAQSKITKEFDSNVKGFINILHSSGTSKMQIPMSEKNSLGIVQSYIVFQLFVFSSKLFNVEIGFTDTSKTKRRLIFSNSSKEIVSNPFHCRVPILNIPLSNWVNISIDVISFVSECFKASTFRSIDYISLTANCKVRRIFSMKNSLNETNKNILSDDLTLDFNENLPKNLSFPQNISFINYNFTYEKIRYELEELKVSEIQSGSVFNNNYQNELNNNMNQINSNTQSNLSNKIISPKGNKSHHNENKYTKNMKNYKLNLNKLKNIDINNEILNYNNATNNKENVINQTNGISNFSSNTNGQTSKNARAKSHSKINNKFKKNIGSNNQNPNNISLSYNKNILKSSVDDDMNLKEKMEKLKENSMSKNKNVNLQQELFDKNKNKLKYNIPVKINKFLKNKPANNNITKKKNNINSVSSSSAGGKTKDETTNTSEKNNKVDDSNINNKLNKQSNGLSKNNEFNYKSNSILLNTLNYKNLDKWENSKDNGGDSIEEIYEIEERNLNGKSMEKNSNNISPDKNKLINNNFKITNNIADREEDVELEDKFYFDIPIKDFKKKSQFKESGNFFSNRSHFETTPKNMTQINLNNLNHNIDNTNTNSNNSNFNTNNQFNFSKNLNNLNFNLNNNLNNVLNITSKNGINKDRDKREIIEEILRDTSSGSFFAKLENDRPFTPPFTKLVPMNSLVSLEKINTSMDKEVLVNNINPSFINIQQNQSISIKSSNFHSSDIYINSNARLNEFHGKVNINDSKILDKSYKIKDINYMDLIYDHVMGYYYDPKTNIYYELKNPGNSSNINI